MKKTHTSDKEKEYTEAEFLRMLEKEQQWMQSHWQKVYKNAIEYVKSNYLDLHPNNVPLERVEQIQRNLLLWKNTSLTEYPDEVHPEQPMFVKWLESNIEQMEKRIIFLRSQTKTKPKATTRTKNTHIIEFFNNNKIKEVVRDGIIDSLKSYATRKDFKGLAERVKKEQKNQVMKNFDRKLSKVSFLRSMFPEVEISSKEENVNKSKFGRCYNNKKK